MTAEENISLLPYNTFGVDVKARYLIKITKIEEAREVISDKKFKALKKLVLGGGSNVLFTSDYDGIVIRNELPGHSIVSEDENSVIIDAGAGENWHSFVMWCVARNYGGLENLSLIPGSVGAGPMQNIGAYGVEIRDSVIEVEFMDIENGEIIVFDKDQCEFGYRNSIFKSRLAGKIIISRVRLKLSKKPVYNTSYGDIETELGKMGLDHSVANISAAVIKIRRSKLPDPALTGNAGSFFKNPVIDASLAESIRSKFGNVPLYPAGEGKVKVAAGWLIENAGWKGMVRGSCGVHSKQALVLINLGGAKGAEVLKLASDITADVFEKFGVKLEREVNVY